MTMRSPLDSDDSEDPVDPLHTAVMDLAWQIRALSMPERETFQGLLYIVLRETNALRRERDRYRAQATLAMRLLRYNAEQN